MTTRLLIEGRDSHQSMYANLTRKQTVGEVSGDAEGRRLDAGFVSRLIVIEHGLKAVTLAPAGIHAEQHLSPVLRFGSTGSGVNGNDGVVAIGLSAQECLSLEILHLSA